MKARCRIVEGHTSPPPPGRWGAMQWRPGGVRTLFRYVRPTEGEGTWYEWGTGPHAETAYRIPADKVEILEVLEL